MATTINTTNAAAFIPEIWSKEALSFVNKNLVMANLVSRYDAEIKFGDTLNVPKAGGFVANDKIAGSTVTAQAPTNTSVTININKHKEVSFYVEDIAAYQSAYDLRMTYTENAGIAIAEAIDTDLLALAAGFSNSVGSYASDIDEDVVLAAKLKLDLANAPRSNRNFVINPAQENALLKIDRFTRQDTLGPNVSIKEGMIGRIHGFDVYSTPQVKTVAGETNNIAFHKSAIALALQVAPRAQTQYKQEYLAWLVTIDTVYGVGEIEDSYGVLVKSK